MIGDTLKTVLDSSRYFVFFQFGDLKSQEWNDARHELNMRNIKMQVFPNKLSCKVLEESKYQELNHFFRNSVITCFSSTDNLKDLMDATKKYSKLELLGGIVDDELMSRRQIFTHSKLPPANVLKASLLQDIMQPCQRLVATLDRASRLLSNNLQQFKAQKTCC